MRQNSVRIRKLRAKYRKRLWIVAVICLVIGIAIGLYLGYVLYGQIATDAPGIAPTATPYIDITPTPQIADNMQTATEVPTEVPTEAPTATPMVTSYTIDLPDPTATPEPTPTPAPVVKAIVPFGQSYSFTTQINADGSVRTSNGDGAFETLNFTVTMKQFMRPGDYANKYANQYKLQGTEAGAGFEIILNDYTGSTEIRPQNALSISLETASGVVERGYQLMNAEIAGDYNIAVVTNTPKMLYKRYLYSNAVEEMKYLAISTCNNGVVEKILFELEPEVVVTPTPVVVYPTLQTGDKSDAVIELQERLRDLGYLEGSADGQYGNKTAEAVKKAQEHYGLPVTGVADDALQQKLHESMQ